MSVYVAGIKENGSYANVALSNKASLNVAIADRPSQVRARTLIDVSIMRTTLTVIANTIYTVTPNKTLFMEAFIASSINNSNTVGEWRIQDGTTDKIGFLAGEKAPNNLSIALAEPIPFTTAVKLIQISGDMHVAFWFIGYEE